MVKDKAMLGFRILLVLMLLALTAYTGVVIANHGWNLLPVFFGDMAAMTWPLSDSMITPSDNAKNNSR